MDHETRRVGEIEAEIAETRVEMSETIEAIQERLSPSNIVANAKESVRQAATEKVRNMTDNAFVDAIRDNPIPAAMIGIGAAWLYFKRRSDAGGNYSGSRSYREDYRAGFSGESGSAQSYAVGTRGSVAGAAGERYGDTVGSAGRDLTSRTREMADEVRETARQTTRKAQIGFNEVLQDNPLVLGAAAALIGAAVGMSFPATQAEDRLMGETRDVVVERAQHAVSEAATQAADAASSMQKTSGGPRS
jgi:hypothetical protein